MSDLLAKIRARIRMRSESIADPCWRERFAKLQCQRIEEVRARKMNPEPKVKSRSKGIKKHAPTKGL